MISPIHRPTEDYLFQQSGSSGAASAPADRSIEPHPTRRQNSLNAVGWMRSFFQGPSDGAISQALSAVAQQIEAGVSLNQALTESGLRSEIQQRLGPSLLQKILGMVKERNADILETSTLGLASQLRKDQLQVAQGILSVLQQDPHVSKETREQALAAYNANADQGPISGRLGHWMQDTVEHMSGLGMVPVIGATAGGRIFETIVLSRLGPVATGLGARILVGAASLGLETTVAASGSYALNGGEVPLGLRGWATSLTALRLSGAAGNFLVKSMNRLGVASELQSLARTVVPHVAMYTGLYATNLAEGRSPDAIGLVGSVLSMQLAAGVGRGPLRFIEGLRGELEIRREISRYTSEPNAGTGLASPFGRLAEVTASSGTAPLRGTKSSSVLEDVLAARPAMMVIDDEGRGTDWRDAALRAPLPDGTSTSMQEELIGGLAADAIKGNSEAMSILERKAESGFLQAVFALESISVSDSPQFPSEHRSPSEISMAARKALQSPKISEVLAGQAGNSEPHELALTICALSGSTDAAKRLTEMARVGVDGVERSIEQLQELAIQGKLGAVAILAHRLNSKEVALDVNLEARKALEGVANSFKPEKQNGHLPTNKETAMAAKQVLSNYDQKIEAHEWTDVWSHLGAKRISFHLEQIKIAVASEDAGGLVKSPPDGGETALSGISWDGDLTSLLRTHAIQGEAEAVRFLALAEEAAQGSPQAVFALESIVLSGGPLFPGEHRPPQYLLTAARKALQSPKISEALAGQARNSELHEQALEVCALYGSTTAAKQLFEMAEAGPGGTGLGGIRSVEQLQALAIQGKLGAVAVLAKLGETDRDPKAIIALDAIVKFYKFKAGEHPPHEKTSKAARQVLSTFEKGKIFTPHLRQELIALGDEESWPHIDQAEKILDSYGGEIIVRSWGEVDGDMRLEGGEVGEMMEVLKMKLSDLLPTQINLWQHLGPERRAFHLAQRKIAAATTGQGNLVESPRDDSERREP